MELMQANRQWATRTPDERFLSLLDMESFMDKKRRITRESDVDYSVIEAQPRENDGLVLAPKGDSVNGMALSNWGFTQLCAAAKAPSRYIASLPAPIAATNLNHGLANAEKGKILWERGTGKVSQADKATQPTIVSVGSDSYGRVWNLDVVRYLIQTFGDGVNGDWRVPGEFGILTPVTKQNTTLYASDRDMFVFLADEKNKVQINNRRDGKHGALSRGFFLWNSENGDGSIGGAYFLNDYTCANRIVWGVQYYQPFKFRHRGESVYDRFMSALLPAVNHMKTVSLGPTDATIKAAQTKLLGHTDEDAIDFLIAKGGFTKATSEKMLAIHVQEEGEPVRTVWGAVTAATAFARGVPNTNNRVNIEKAAGKILDLVAERA